MPAADQKPGKGAYTCKLCGQTVELDDDLDKLPVCPRCNAAEYHKLSQNIAEK